MTDHFARTICRQVRREYGHINARKIRIDRSTGEVSAYVDSMPNASKAGRIFCGWDRELAALGEMSDAAWRGQA
jgi:hypothetical protein